MSGCSVWKMTILSLDSGLVPECETAFHAWLLAAAMAVCAQDDVSSTWTSTMGAQLLFARRNPDGTRALLIALPNVSGTARMARPDAQRAGGSEGFIAPIPTASTESGSCAPLRMLRTTPPAALITTSRKYRWIARACTWRLLERRVHGQRAASENPAHSRLRLGRGGIRRDAESVR
ncbi:MAG: hypothetical protein U0521_12400 [Anaerolineae bacterium]